ncbi:hypothetical protein [Magnetofaba australis]|nr:hypothetical protein [Magnetofaba australis]
MDINGFPPGQVLHRQIKGAFVAKGTTFTAWCRENGISPAAGKNSLLGAWDGPKGRQVRQQLIEAAGLTADSSGNA